MAKAVRGGSKSRKARPPTSVGQRFLTTNSSELLTAIREVIANLDRQKRETHLRRVCVGDLLTDRWQIARDYGFGDGTSCYDNVLILGNVVAGRNCWIGPNVILDGSGNLSIGDYVDISAGVQIYTHDTVRRVRSGGTEPVQYAPTRIGSRVYIGPQSVIQRGVTIGDDVTIGAMSFVNRDVPRGTTVWGIPARPSHVPAHQSAKASGPDKRESRRLFGRSRKTLS